MRRAAEKDWDGEGMENERIDLSGVVGEGNGKEIGRLWERI